MGFAVDEFPYTSEYDSDLRAVLKYVREIKTKINGYDEIIAELEEALKGIQGMDARITALELATSDLNDIRTHISNIDIEIINITNQHNLDVNRLQKQIDTLKTSIESFDSDIEAARSYSLFLYNKLKYELESEITENFMDVYATVRAVQNEVRTIRKRLDAIDTSVLNPWHTELGRVTQDVNVKLIYNDLADECLTAEQYCRLGLTADQYATYKLPARWYAEFGKTKLPYRWVYSPAFGFRQDINVVLTSILNAIMDTLTADEYAALDLDADGYALLDLSAWDYFSFMADEGYLKLDGNGITAGQYASITT